MNQMSKQNLKGILNIFKNLKNNIFLSKKQGGNPQRNETTKKKKRKFLNLKTKISEI